MKIICMCRVRIDEKDRNKLYERFAMRTRVLNKVLNKKFEKETIIKRIK